MSFPDLSKFRNKRILVVGDIMLDEFINTSSTRQSPEYKIVPVYDVQEKQSYLGGAANVAFNIKSLESIPYLIGVIGNDVSGQTIISILIKENIATDYLYTSSRRKTTSKTRILKDNEPICRIDDEISEDLSGLENSFLLKKIQQCITDHKPHAILIQDYNKGVLNTESIPQILALAKENNIPVCVDPKFKNWELYSGTDLFKPNLNEFRIMSDELRVESNELKLIAQKLLERIQFKNLLVTLGAEGNYMYNASQSQILNLKSQIQHPDVCGAGDTVIAVATLGIVCGFSLEETAELANRSGLIACQKKNVQPVSLEELRSTNY